MSAIVEKEYVNEIMAHDEILLQLARRGRVVGHPETMREANSILAIHETWEAYIQSPEGIRAEVLKASESQEEEILASIAYMASRKSSGNRQPRTQERKYQAGLAARLRHHSQLEPAASGRLLADTVEGAWGTIDDASKQRIVEWANGN